MKGAELCDQLRRAFKISSDSKLASAIGVTAGRVSQIRATGDVSLVKAARYTQDVAESQLGKEFRTAIRP
jgi:hypothetical protein